MGFIYLLIIAITPGISIAIFIYYKDSLEPEPVRLLLLSFFYGVLSCLMALIISLPMDNILNLNEQDFEEQGVRAILVAVIEECCKFIFVRGILYRNKNFNEPMDGIVYAVMVGMGFATAENAIYVINEQDGAAIVRMFTAIPAHAMFAIMMGYFLGKAKFTHRKEFYYALVALGAATAFHATYNYFIFISFIHGMWVLSIVSLVIAFILSTKAIRVQQEASPFKIKLKFRKGWKENHKS